MSAPCSSGPAAAEALLPALVMCWIQKLDHLDLHSEMEKSWKNPYVKIPPVEEMVARHLSQSEVSSLKDTVLLTKPCQTTLWLVGKVYVAAGQAGGAQNMMADLQAFQVDPLKDLDQGQGLSVEAVAELCRFSATHSNGGSDDHEEAIRKLSSLMLQSRPLDSSVRPLRQWWQDSERQGRSQLQPGSPTPSLCLLSFLYHSWLVKIILKKGLKNDPLFFLELLPPLSSRP